MKLSNKQKRSIRREIDIELGINPEKTKVHRNKKKYTRKSKHSNPNLNINQKSN
jgi:hypothetical protein|tara:strand:- start:777 stop:938 length:162 start_codon:yes stop_codon:yes gene_type:complete